MTAADSRKILLSNLPSDCSVAEARSLADKYGAVKEVTFLHEQADSVTMAIEFENHLDALAAVQHLNDQPFGERPIMAQLDARTQVFARSPLHSPILMVSWPGATLTAWAFYPNVTLAKAAAAKLDKTTFQDRTLTVTFDRPGKRGPYSIRISDLPPGATKAEVDAFCAETKPELITLGSPTYTESPEDHVKADLEKFGRVESFRISSVSETNFRTTAYATMHSYTVADAAAVALTGYKPGYLGKETLLRVQHVYLAKYNTPVETFSCIQDRVNILRDKYKGKCKISTEDDGFFTTIEIRAPIAESTLFAEANGELNELVDGIVIKDEQGVPVWDPYLEHPSSSKVISKINDPSSDVPCIVHCDTRLKCVRVYGSVDGQERGKSILLKTLKRVRAQCNEVEVHRSKVPALIEGGLTKVQDSLVNGVNKVTFDIVRAKLIVRGEHTDLEKAKEVLSTLGSQPLSDGSRQSTSLSANTSSSRSASTARCPLCERIPVSPVKLGCRHVYCKACFKFGLDATAKRENVSPLFRCVFKKPHHASAEPSEASPETSAEETVCGEPIPYIIVRDHLTLSTEMNYLKAAFLHKIQNNSPHSSPTPLSSSDSSTTTHKFFFCPTPECPAVYRAGEEGIVVRCAGCSSDLCPKCCSRMHDGSLCQDR